MNNEGEQLKTKEIIIYPYVGQWLFNEYRKEGRILKEKFFDIFYGSGMIEDYTEEELAIIDKIEKRVKANIEKLLDKKIIITVYESDDDLGEYREKH